MTWNYEIIRENDEWLLVERFHDDSDEEPKLDGAYSIVFNCGGSREDIIHMIQLIVTDIMTDEEKRELDKMFSFREGAKEGM